jgi:long-chain acyl-CoA synthetase
VTSRNDSISGTVGGPVPNTEFKLVDVPEMLYTSQDKDSQGNKKPRGEICLKGHGIFLGYFKDEEKTKEMID